MDDDLASLNRQEVGTLLFKFMEWYIKHGRPGDSTVGGKQVGRNVVSKCLQHLQIK
jgi:hypothetical protein